VGLICSTFFGGSLPITGSGGRIGARAESAPISSTLRESIAWMRTRACGGWHAANFSTAGSEGQVEICPAIKFMKNDVDYNVERRIYRDRGVRLVAVSHLPAKHLESHFRRADVMVIPNAVDTRKFAEAERIARRSASRQSPPFCRE
jgi:hypothetical protein